MMICEGKPVADLVRHSLISAGDSVWERRIGYMKPKNVLELGTGQGASGAQIMAALSPDAIFTTVNYCYPEDYVFGEQLSPWKGDKRLRMISADTLLPESVGTVTPGVDLMFLDTHHEAWHAATELRLWQDVLLDGAIVVVDDIGVGDMHRFWDSIPYDKFPPHTEQQQGVFRYDASRRYTTEFQRGKTGRG